MYPENEYPEEVRAEREKALLSECDDRSGVEKLIDFMAAARVGVYKPAAPPSMRHDIICLCCGNLYRPDDVYDGENIFLCGSCILTRRETR